MPPRMLDLIIKYLKLGHFVILNLVKITRSSRSCNIRPLSICHLKICFTVGHLLNYDRSLRIGQNFRGMSIAYSESDLSQNVLNYNGIRKRETHNVVTVLVCRFKFLLVTYFYASVFSSTQQSLCSIYSDEHTGFGASYCYT